MDRLGRWTYSVGDVRGRQSDRQGMRLIKGIFTLAIAMAWGATLQAQDLEPDPAEQQPQTPAVEAEKLDEGLAPAVKSGAVRYRSLGDRDAVLAGWLAGGLAQELELGQSAGRRELFGVQFGGQGPLPLEARPMILLIGGLDGRSLAGSEAVIQITDQLMAQSAELSGAVTYVVVPWANPDGLARWVTTGSGEGRNDRALDDDGDGLVDEDPADDLDGDGVLMEMLIEDPKGDWVRSEDRRFLRRARQGEAPRYRRCIEGRDDDGDGQYNEDPQGGVLLDRNFPVNWEGPWQGSSSGPWPLSEPESLALAKLVLERRTAAVLLYQGNHGQLAMPGGRQPAPGLIQLPFAADLPVYRRMVEIFNARTGRQQAAPLRLCDAYGDQRAGVAMDWFYTAAGALTMEVGIWGPQVLKRSSDVAEAGALEANRGPAEVGGASLSDRETLEQAWARWLDESQGGLGFADWTPIDLGDGREALIGGWERFTNINPPSSLLSSVVKGQADFVLDIGRGLPKLDIVVENLRRNGRIVIVQAHVRNLGSLPTGVGPDAAGGGTLLRLKLPEGVTMVAGELENELGHLPAQGQSASFEWLFVAPEKAVIQLEVESAWAAPLGLEVRLDR